MVTIGNEVKELVKHPTATAFHWVTYEWELRAFIDNPLGKHNGEPAYLLVTIEDADAESQMAVVKEVGYEYEYFVKFEMLTCIHQYIPATNRVIQILGNPKVG